MDYSKFVKAILEEDDVASARLVNIITPVLIKFLRVRFGVNKLDAEDCAQNTLLIAIEKIRSGKLENPDVVISYLFTTAKNEYFKLLAKEKESTFSEPPESYHEPADQLSQLLNEEKMAILRKCVEELKDDFKAYINYWFGHAGNETAVVAQHFGISVNNAWTKKHRIINILKKCYLKKIQL